MSCNQNKSARNEMESQTESEVKPETLPEEKDRTYKEAFAC